MPSAEISRSALATFLSNKNFLTKRGNGAPLTVSIFFYSPFVALSTYSYPERIIFNLSYIIYNSPLYILIISHIDFLSIAFLLLFYGNLLFFYLFGIIFSKMAFSYIFYNSPFLCLLHSKIWAVIVDNHPSIFFINSLFYKISRIFLHCS